MANELSIFRGDTETYIIKVVDVDDVVVDITGAEIKFTVRDMQTDVQAMQLTTTAGTVVITNAAGGVAEARLVPNDTKDMMPGDYIYDFEFTMSGDVFTAVKSIIEIKRDVTHA